ncbi:hypothetical protein [Halobacillus massiliensis]|uniref:hypothetical protein n=1 Tax=Halobacillus massiliensis TaxID=1926286 RepID=UPI0009E37A43|nr:hypothetical protein [Halobacillus massiliensis]
MELFRKNAVWLIPAMVILAGICLLFYENYQKVTEPPNDSWSREVNVGSTPFSTPPVLWNKENNEMISFLTSEGITTASISPEFNIDTAASYSIPADKWTKFYIDEKALIYSDYYSMYNESGNKISDINQFFPLKDFVLYKKDDAVYQLDPHTEEETKLLSLENDQVQTEAVHSGDKNFLLLYVTEKTTTNLKIFEINEEGIDQIVESSFDLADQKVINSLQFGLNANEYALVVTATEKAGGSSKTENFYSISSYNEDPKLNPLTLMDPAGKGELSSLSELSLSSENGVFKILAAASGSTNTLYKTDNQFNIYETVLTSDGASKTERLSNTSRPSTAPQSLNNKSIVWMDHKGENYQILLSSSNEKALAKAESFPSGYFLDSLGKTMGMIAISFFTLIVGGLWFVWPLLFLAIIMFVKGSSVDRNKAWVYYIGAAIYLLFAFIFQDRVFSEKVMNRAPEFLTFTASPFIFIILFAVLVHGTLQISKKRNWSVSVQLFYLISIHLLFVMTYFGPYLL